ncbi:MAG: hypothetical protein WBA93_07510, partial [Microcoleaceae cyanobacterium]
ISSRVPFHLSPDGKCLAITVESGERNFPSSTNKKENNIPHKDNFGRKIITDFKWRVWEV